MKKLHLSLLLFAMFSMAAMAANPVTVVSGSTSFLKENAEAVVSFNWEETQWKDGGLFKEEVDAEEFSKYTASAPAKFKEGFNQKSKHLRIGDNKEKAKYAINIKVLKIDYFFSVMSIVPGHKHTVWARIEVVDQKSKEVVCTLHVERLKGARDFIVDDSFYKCFSALGQAVAQQ